MRPPSFHLPMAGILLGLFLLTTNLSAQVRRSTLSGYVRDAQTGEMLVGASLWLPEIQSGNPFEEPALIPSNIQNGLGCFGSCVNVRMVRPLSW
ncbi:MAG: DUF4249 domain-containing protein [Bacteroidia bacterium]|nr:DUF4249 domain-containing protein [Bacteroidia bacterium]